MRNIIQVFLCAIGIPYTKQFSEELFEGHPNKNNMLGLSQMLKVYGMDMIGVRFTEKEDVELPIPCIVHINGGFVVATKLAGNKISYLWNDNSVTKEFSEFCQIWTGHALIVRNQDFTNAVEPNYKSNKRRENLRLLLKYVLAFSSALILVAGFITFGSIRSVPQDIDFVFSAIGLMLCIILIQKQLFKTSKWGDKMCSFFHQTDCNNVLHTQYGKIGMLTWSEVGTGYFLARFICLSFFPDADFSLFVINLCAMTYFIWSIWIQAILLKKFCTLCLFVQIVIWSIGVSNLYAVYKGDITVSRSVFPFILSGSIILLTILCVHCFLKMHSYTKELQDVKWKLRSFKSDMKIFEYKLKQGIKIDDGTCQSGILFGNESARWQITILSNPHCNPCARMHERVEHLLEKYGDLICVRYVFTSFSEELEASARFLISIYLQLGIEAARVVYKNWYTNGKYRFKDYIKSFDLDYDSEQVLMEEKKHKEWKNKTGLLATPTVIINGYELPEDYTLEDIIFII